MKLTAEQAFQKCVQTKTIDDILSDLCKQIEAAACNAQTYVDVTIRDSDDVQTIIERHLYSLGYIVSDRPERDKIRIAW